MDRFIELNVVQSGKKILINVRWISKIISLGNGTIVYVNSGGGRDAIEASEPYDQIKGLINNDMH